MIIMVVVTGGDDGGGVEGFGGGVCVGDGGGRRRCDCGGSDGCYEDCIGGCRGSDNDGGSILYSII